MHKANWDDYRFILAIADRGTSMAAAERLGVNHTTVLRRIAGFEAVHGIRLFTRSSAGYVPTIEGEAVIGTAREMSEKLTEMRRNVLGEAVRLEGTLTVTTTDSILEGALAQHLARFSTLHPLIHLDLSITSTRLNLTRRDADIAIRPSLRPPDDLVARRVSGLGFAVYTATDNADIALNTRLEAQDWVGLGDALRGAPAGEWIRRTVPEEKIVMRLDTFSGIRDCIRAGVGIGVIPCCLADGHADLVRVTEPMAELDTGIWVLTHRDLQGSARVSAFVEHIAAGLMRDACVLEGRSV